MEWTWWKIDWHLPNNKILVYGEFRDSRTFNNILTKIICGNIKKYYLYTTKQNNLKMNEIKIKSKSVKFLTSKVKGWLKLTDGSKTHFEVQNNGEWEQWGNSRENLCVSVPFMYELVDFYLNEN